jgi:hypothetical protein
VRHRATCLTAQCLSAFAPSMSAIAEEGMDLCIADPIVQTGALAAGEALGINGADRTTPAFHLAPGPQQWMRQPPCRCCRRWQATGSAVMGRAGFQQPLDEGAERGAVAPAGTCDDARPRLARPAPRSAPAGTNRLSCTPSRRGFRINGSPTSRILGTTAAVKGQRLRRGIIHHQ